MTIQCYVATMGQKIIVFVLQPSEKQICRVSCLKVMCFHTKGTNL